MHLIAFLDGSSSRRNNGAVSTDDLVSSLLSGRAKVDADLKLHLSERDGPGLADKLRQAYWWIVNNAILCPYYDMEFGAGTYLHRQNAGLELHQDTSYASYVLLPLLTLAAGGKLLIIGAPGRGKTTIAILMGLLAGYPPSEMRRAVQRGHPQLTVADLLGGPLPGDLVRAESPGDIRVAWRNWLTLRVKVVDEYNRIPTKTQSALLSLMAEGYAEMYEQVVETGKSAWFLTANDDLGGGTFQVIEALKDRIDVVVRSTAFNSRYLGALVQRVEADRSPEDFVPRDVVFTEDELKRVRREIRAVELPAEIRDILGFFLGQLDFCRRASEKFEYMNKDTLHLSGKKVGDVCNEECPLDKQSNLCTQTESGVSVRVFLTTILYSKALAYFRGNSKVEMQDLDQILPWILHEKLAPNRQSAYFDKPANQVLLTDRVSWIRRMFDTATKQYAAHEPLRQESSVLRDELDRGLEGVPAAEAKKRLSRVRTALEKCFKSNELNGPCYEELIHLKSIHSRYQNYLNWLERK